MMSKSKTQNGTRSDLTKGIILAISDESPKLYKLQPHINKNINSNNINKSTELCIQNNNKSYLSKTDIQTIKEIPSSRRTKIRELRT